MLAQQPAVRVPPAQTAGNAGHAVETAHEDMIVSLGWIPGTVGWYWALWRELGELNWTGEEWMLDWATEWPLALSSLARILPCFNWTGML